MFFRPKMVRLHLYGEAPSIQGILVSRPDRFYKLAKPELINTERDNVALEGEVWLAENKVLFMQVLS